MLGAASQHNLGYLDGYLANHLYHEAAEKITDIITATIDEYTEPIEIDMMTFDLNGLSGHIDHIFASRVACYVFYAHKESDNRFRRIRFMCIPKQYSLSYNTNWLYMDAGRDDTEYTTVVDAREYRDTIIAVMRAYRSQRDDCEHHLEQRGDNLGIDYFIVQD